MNICLVFYTGFKLCKAKTILSRMTWSLQDQCHHNVYQSSAQRYQKAQPGHLLVFFHSNACSQIYLLRACSENFRQASLHSRLQWSGDRRRRFLFMAHHVSYSMMLSLLLRAQTWAMFTLKKRFHSHTCTSPKRCTASIACAFDNFANEACFAVLICHHQPRV